MEQRRFQLSSFRVSFISWTVVMILMAVQLLAFDRQHNNYLPLFHYIIWPGLTYYSWALLTPFVFAFCRRYPLAPTLTRVLQYGVAAVLFTCVQVTMDGLGGWFYKPEGPPGMAVVNALGKGYFLGVQACVVLFVLAAYQRIREETRLREMRAAELEARLASAELEMLRIQLHPHFLFNTLQAVSVLLHEDPNAAEDVLLRLSELLRVALHDMRDQEVSLEQELAFLDLYLGIQKQRFRDRLQVSVMAEPEALSSKVPSLLLQPLVENALHHGIGRHRGTDSVEVSAGTKNGFLQIEVRNFASSLNEKGSAGNGVGLRNLRARLEQLYGEAATIELRPIVPAGVSAFVRIPGEWSGRPAENGAR